MPDTTSPEIQTETVQLSVSDGTTLPAYVARPAQGGKAGLLVLQEAFGVNAHIRDLTERFAREGYTAIAPALFHRTGPDFEGTYTDFPAVMPHMQGLTDAGQGADIKAAYDWLKSEAGGAATPSARPATAWAGARPSSPTPSSPSRRPSPTTAAASPAVPCPCSRTCWATPPDLHAPILLFWGGKDGHIGSEIVRAVEDALKAADKPYAQVVFSQADHGFFCDARESYNPEAAAQAWPLTLAFFAAHLTA